MAAARNWRHRIPSPRFYSDTSYHIRNTRAKKKSRCLARLSATGHVQGWGTDHQHLGFFGTDIRPAMGEIAFEVQCVPCHQAILFAMDGKDHRTLQAILELLSLMRQMAALS